MRTSLAQMAPVSVSGNSGSEKTMRSLRLSGEIAVMPRDQKEGERSGFDRRRKKRAIELRKDLSVGLLTQSRYKRQTRI
ncbi:hypothetical protein AHAS_Ahas06G0141600 [Arachis hypogaea]